MTEPYPGEPVYFTCFNCHRVRHKTWLVWRGSNQWCAMCARGIHD